MFHRKDYSHKWNGVDNVAKRWTLGERQTWVCILALLLVWASDFILNVGSYLQNGDQECHEDFEQDVCKIPT